eukprot:PhM_4_TR4170/c0_g1_i1/m.50431
MNCTHDGNAEGAKFCRHCGMSLSGARRGSASVAALASTSSSEFPKCGSCGALAKKADPKFCGECGAKFSGSTPNNTVTPVQSTPHSPPAPPTILSPAKQEEPPNLSQPQTVQATQPPVKKKASVVDPVPEEHKETEADKLKEDTSITLKMTADFTPSMLNSANLDDLTGWRVGTLLGKGSFGTVFLSMLRSGKIVAVKQIHIVGNETSEYEPLVREVGTMRKLHHKNIAAFLGCEVKEHEVNIFMEYVSGGSLADIIKKFKPLPASVISSYTKQILLALDYLHNNRIIHRDIKADNILVETSTVVPLDHVIKLADFGTSKHLQSTIAKCKTFVGTPYWMAPEVLTAPEGYTTKADIWSVGCTVVEMLTGKPPWPQKQNVHQAVYMIGSGQTPMEIPTDLPEDLKDFLDKCFERDSANRPSAEELLHHPFLSRAE